MLHIKLKRMEHRAPCKYFVYSVLTCNLGPRGGFKRLKHVFFLKYTCKGKGAMSTTQAHNMSHEISNNVVCSTSKGSDQPAYTHSLIRALAMRLNIL